MYKFLVVVVLALAAPLVASTNVHECDNGVPLPAIVDILNCVDMPCDFVQDTDMIMNATFRSQGYTETLVPEVIAYALGVEVNYPLNEKNGCNALLNVRCPIEEGETVIYQLNMPVSRLYPTISLSLKFTLYGDDEEPLVCFMVDAKVVSG